MKKMSTNWDYLIVKSIPKIKKKRENQTKFQRMVSLVFFNKNKETFVKEDDENSFLV